MAAETNTQTSKTIAAVVRLTHKRTHVVAHLCLALAITVLSTSSRADTASDRARGEQIAATRCFQCHAIGPTDESPTRITTPFRDLKARFPIAMLTEALTTGIINGHDEMPMREFGVSDVRALVIYIDSLNPNGPHYIPQPN